METIERHEGLSASGQGIAEFIKQFYGKVELVISELPVCNEVLVHSKEKN